MDVKKSKTYAVVKKINQEAKIIGLNYNTFFVFVLVAAITTMIASSFGLIFFVVVAILLFVFYFFLVFIQTKLGYSEMFKRINHFYQPINYIKIKASIKRILK